MPLLNKHDQESFIMSEIPTLTQETEDIHQPQSGKLCSSSRLDQVLFGQLKSHTQEIMDRCE